ncbi:MAG TPA: helical backbone metal receptor [Bryobacteraceae bacterium]|nr:helical backbone metal receptor [Bryobacteraceae bacterium]
MSAIFRKFYKRTAIALMLTGLLSAAEARRIVSTAPSATEMIFALGLGERVVGVTTYCNYPPEARKITKVATYIKPDIERILVVRPDLVVIPKTPLHTRAPYDAVKLNVLEVKYDSIADIYHSISAIAAAGGVPERGKALSASIEKQLDAVKQSVKALKPTSVMFVVGRTPNSLDGLVAVGKTSYLTEVIELAGGRNIFSDASNAYPKISREEILTRNPEVILDMGDMSETSGVTEQHKRSVVALWGQYAPLRAVQSGRVHAIASDIFVVPGPRVVELARQLARLLHPEAIH